VNEHPGYLVIDLGAQIGQYSLFAAKMGHDVIAIEPFFDNLLRIHKAAFIERTLSRITLVYNAISNRRNELKSLKKSVDNIGGQFLENLSVQGSNEEFTDKYLTNTILFDDIVRVIQENERRTGKVYTKAVLKIDIEGHEIYAFEHAEKLFQAISIEMVFMEWGNLVKLENKESKRIVRLIKFMESMGYYPFMHHVVLDTELWINWPWDIVWKKKSLKEV
jgi:FkbM family methyltransferase